MSKSNPTAGMYVRINRNTIGQDGAGDNQWATSLWRQFETAFSVLQKEKCQEGPIYVDVASGNDPSRPAYRQMLKDAKAGKFSVLITHSPDRLVRDGFDGMRILEIFRKRGIKIALPSAKGMTCLK